MPYGTLKADTLIFTNGGIDQSVTVSGIFESISGNLTVTGTISGDVIRGGTTVSGATITGAIGQFSNLTAVSGVFTTQISGATVTGNVGRFTSVTGGTAGFTTVTGTTVTGTTANFISGNFTNISGGTHTITSGVFASGTAANPSISFVSDPNTGIYSPGADQVAISTNGTGRLFVDASGNVGIGATPNSYAGYSTLTINNTTGSELDFEVNDTLTSDIYTDSAGTYWTTRTAVPIVLRTNSIERLRVTSAGLVGIGTSSPGSRLEVGGESAPRVGINSTGLDTTGLLFQGAGTTYGSIIENISTGELAIKAGASGQNSYFITFGTNDGTERARIDSSGRLLVGTSTDFDSYLNQVSSTSGSLLSLRRTNSNPGSIKLSSGASGDNVGSGSNLGYLRWYGFHTSTDYEAARISAEVDGTPGANDMPGRLVFSTTADGASNPTERMRISQDGRTWINTSSQIFAGFGLHVVYSGGACAFKETSGTGANNLQVNWHTATSNDNRFIEFGTEASYTIRGSITYNRGGGVTAYNTTSDYRAKTLLGDVENTGQTIDALKVYRGVMNGATIERPMLVAHEAREVAPYCVTGEKDAVDDDGNPIYQQMDHQVLVPLLIAEIQQLRARVAALEGA